MKKTDSVFKGLFVTLILLNLLPQPQVYHRVIVMNKVFLCVLNPLYPRSYLSYKE